MATDLTAVAQVTGATQYHSFGTRWIWKSFNIATDLITTKNVTYELVDIGATDIVLRGLFVVTAVFGTVATTTFQFKVGAAVLGPAFAISALAKGICINLNYNDFDDAVGGVGYPAVADTVDVFVSDNTNPNTGTFLLGLELMALPT